MFTPFVSSFNTLILIHPALFRILPHRLIRPLSDASDAAGSDAAKPPSALALLELYTWIPVAASPIKLPVPRLMLGDGGSGGDSRATTSTEGGSVGFEKGEDFRGVHIPALSSP